MQLLLADENFSSEVSKLLRDYGHDVITLQSLGLAGIKYPDEKVLEKASSLGRCVLTFNRLDFIKLHKKGNSHAGIIICTFDRDSAGLAARIHSAIDQKGNLKNQLIRIYRGAS